MLDATETQSLHGGESTSLSKANSLPYGSRLSMANTGANSEVSVASTTKDSLIYNMIAGNSPAGRIGSITLS